MRRTELRRKTPLVATKPLTGGGQLRPVSQKRLAELSAAGERVFSTLRGSQRLAPRSKNREAEEREYSKRRVLFLLKHPKCRRCGDQSTDVHHSGGREGWRLLFEPWWIALCRRCHEWVTDNPIEAIKAGLSRKRHGINSRGEQA